MLKSIYPVPESWQINKDIKSICEKTHHQVTAFYMVLELIAKEGEKGTSSKITAAWSVGASPSPLIKEKVFHYQQLDGATRQ